MPTFNAAQTARVGAMIEMTGDILTQLIIHSNQKTMSSLEIAELVESNHADVRRSIERLSERGVIALTPLDEVSNTGLGPRTISVYRLDKRSSLIVVAKISPQHIGAIVDAWGRTQQSLDELIAALDAFDVPEECEGMYVYAIRNTTTGNVKLGISSNPENRLKQLQTGNDCTLELVACRKAENRFQDESALHHAHSAAHIRGEWFNESASNAIALSDGSMCLTNAAKVLVTTKGLAKLAQVVGAGGQGGLFGGGAA